MIAGLGLICAGTLNAAWEFDSISPPNRPTGPNAQSVLDVYRTLQRMMERWNAHDLEGYLDYFWKSPDLLAVSDAQQFSEWQELHDEYLRSFHNPDEMGQAAHSRIQIRMIRPDLAPDAELLDNQPYRFRVFFGIVSHSAIYLESCPDEVAARRWQGHYEVKGN